MCFYYFFFHLLCGRFLLLWLLSFVCDFILCSVSVYVIDNNDSGNKKCTHNTHSHTHTSEAESDQTFGTIYNTFAHTDFLSLSLFPALSWAAMLFVMWGSGFISFTNGITAEKCGTYWCVQCVIIGVNVVAKTGVCSVQATATQNENECGCLLLFFLFLFN